jgi:hypothetical protein
MKTTRALKSKSQKPQDIKTVIDAYRKQFAKSLKHISIEEINELKNFGRR